MRFVICIGVIAILCSCGVKVPNPTGHLQLPSGAAVSRKLFTEDEKFIPKDVWDRQRIGTVCYTPTDVGKLINFIEEVCARGQTCVSDWQKKLAGSMNNMRIRRK